MKKTLLIILLCFICITGLFASGSVENAVPEKGIVRIVLEPGSEYKTTTWWYLFPIDVYPQVSVWLESSDSRIIRQLYSSSKIQKQDWIDAPDSGRPEALPVWTHRLAGIEIQTEKPDAVSSATPSGTTDQSVSIQNIQDYIAENADTDWYIYLEANRSYDYNEYYSEERSGVNGQPSLVYRSLVSFKDGVLSAGPLELIGTGSLTGSDGTIHSDLSRITTAEDLFSSMTISFVY